MGRDVSQAQTNLQQTVAQHRQRQTERARNPYTILIDEPPDSGQYVAIMDVINGRDVLVRRLQLPVYGEVAMTVHEGRVTKVDVRIGEKV